VTRATMPGRQLVPGRWNRHGRAIPDPQPCELDGDVGPDFYRVIAAPQRTPEDMAYIARAKRWAHARALGAFAALAALLALFGAQCFKS
jgi:hypothetical protein